MISAIKVVEYLLGTQCEKFIPKKHKVTSHYKVQELFPNGEVCMKQPCSISSFTVSSRFRVR